MQASGSATPRPVRELSSEPIKPIGIRVRGRGIEVRQIIGPRYNPIRSMSQQNQSAFEAHDPKLHIQTGRPPTTLGS